MVKIDDIQFDEDLYPRAAYSWQVAYAYSQNMLSGAKFPKIVLAVNKGKYYIVDGKHRIEANRMLKNEEVEAIVFYGWSRDRIYKESVRYNASHGRSLTPYEKRKIAVKLLEMNCKTAEVSKLISVPHEKLDSFISQRMVNTFTGKVVTPEDASSQSREIAHAILKGSMKQYAGQTLTKEKFDEVVEDQKSLTIFSQRHEARQMLYILEKGLLDTEDEELMQIIFEIRERLNNL